MKAFYLSEQNQKQKVKILIEKSSHICGVKRVNCVLGLFDLDVGEMKPAALWGVFVLLHTTAPKVHPSQVISVLYPVTGGCSSAGEGGSGLEGRA